MLPQRKNDALAASPNPELWVGRGAPWRHIGALGKKPMYVNHPMAHRSRLMSKNGNNVDDITRSERFSVGVVAKYEHPYAHERR